MSSYHLNLFLLLIGIVLTAMVLGCNEEPDRLFTQLVAGPLKELQRATAN